jgi:hypothetical protein
VSRSPAVAPRNRTTYHCGYFRGDSPNVFVASRPFFHARFEAAARRHVAGRSDRAGNFRAIPCKAINIVQYRMSTRFRETSAASSTLWARRAATSAMWSRSDVHSFSMR